MSNNFKRSSGILTPIFSLPSKYGIGTLGMAAYDFVDFLHDAGQKYWQILPMGHTGFGDSPYQTFSSIAGNPYFIDLDILAADGLLDQADLQGLPESDGKVNYEKVKATKLPLLHKAFLLAKKDSSVLEEVKKFQSENSVWVKDYAMFMALKDFFEEKPIWDWSDKDIVKRTPAALKLYSSMLKDEIEFFIFVQYLFFEQWRSIKQYANKNGIRIIGDIPIYPSADSCDVWVNPQLFKVDENLLPAGIAGVPPDLYSETGQLWGNPVYDWKKHEADNFSWWVDRIQYTLEFADIIRIDHFRGLCDFWEIPKGETTALNGYWMQGPKMALFDAIKKVLGDIPIIAEDLGIITDEVREFLKETGYPGMRPMIFGLSANEDNMYLPHNWEVNSVGYTSTHDSETVCQKIMELPKEDKEFALDYIRMSSLDSIGLSAIKAAFASPASVVIVPIQDLLSLGEEGRMNVPSTVGGNWQWRLKEGQLTNELSGKLYKITKTFKRKR